MPGNSSHEADFQTQRIQQLEKRLHALETERQLFEVQLNLLTAECDRLKYLLAHPTTTAHVKQVLDRSRALLYFKRTDATFIAQIPPHIPSEVLFPGITVKIYPTYCIEAVLS